MSEPGPGEILREARMAMEISCREVAEALNLPVDTVEAIEANDYERLPAAVFTRGYIRAYARLLELESDPVVARFPAANEAEITDVVPEPTLQDVIRDHPRLVLGGAGALVLVVLVSLTAWLWPAFDELRPAAPAAPPVAVESQVLEPARGDHEPTAVAATSEVSMPEFPVPVAAAESTAELPMQVAEATPSGVRRISPTGTDRLWLSFSEDCWVAIKSLSGESLYSDLSRAGRTVELVGRAPFRILLGYAPGVELSFNGEIVALAPHTRNNVASLVLGQ